jgi:hypothetical protein
MSKKRASSNQTLVDLALQLYGNVDKVFDMMEASGIDNLETDPTGVEIVYEVNNSFAQKYFISQGLDVATKPSDYANTDGPALLANIGFLLQEDGYRLLM